MAQKKCHIMSWNPRGLNNKVRREAVHDILHQRHACYNLCLQETKLDVVDNAAISSTFILRECG
jgi:exonuclease III